MAAPVVTFDGNRIHSSDNNTGWGNYVIGGGSPAAEAQLAYQGSAAVNKKITSSAARQGVDYNGTSQDMTTAAKNLLFVKIIVSDSFDLNQTWGIELAMGSGDNSNKHAYCISGTDANLSVYDEYPIQGGYLITAIDPNIDTWKESETGTFDQTAVLWFAVGAQFINGSAKTENVAMDAIDVGRGLIITNGDGGSTDGTFVNFVTTDQNNTSNRWGVVTGFGNSVISHGLLTIGSATATEFTDTDSVVTFPDGYHSRGLVGILVDISNASSQISIDSLIIGNGTRNGVDANDTRPNFIVTGTSGAFESEATLRNHRDVTYTSVCEIENANIECQLLTQGDSHIFNSTINTNSLSSVACVQDPAFGTTTGLHDIDFVQAGSGHAIEIDTAGSYTLTNITFTGYGSDFSAFSVFDVTASTGTVTFNIVGGDGLTPTYTTAGATVVFNLDPIDVIINAVDETGLPVENARIYIEAASTSSDFLFNEDINSAARVGSTAFIGMSVSNIETISIGDTILIEGITPQAYLGAHIVTAVAGSTFEYVVFGSPAQPVPSGTPRCTHIIINTLSDANGEVSLTTPMSGDMDIAGYARKGTTSPVYKTANISGTIQQASGFATTVTMVSDE